MECNETCRQCVFNNKCNKTDIAQRTLFKLISGLNDPRLRYNTALGTAETGIWNAPRVVLFNGRHNTNVYPLPLPADSFLRSPAGFWALFWHAVALRSRQHQTAAITTNNCAELPWDWAVICCKNWGTDRASGSVELRTSAKKVQAKTTQKVYRSLNVENFVMYQVLNIFYILHFLHMRDKNLDKIIENRPNFFTYRQLLYVCMYVCRLITRNPYSLSSHEAHP